MLIVEVGGMAIKTYPLNMDITLWCLLFGSLELVWGVIIKFMPLEMFQCISLDEEPFKENEAEKALSSSFKRSASLRSNKGSGITKK